MFYAQFVLSKKGPLAKIWLAAHWEKKLTKTHVFETSIEKSVEGILQPKVKLALRTTGHLLLGVVRIYSRKAKYLLADCNEAFVKIKMAFRPGIIDLPEDCRDTALTTITLPQVFHDFDTSLADLNNLDLTSHLALNQAREDEITLKEDFSFSNFSGSGFGMDLGDMMSAGGMGGFGEEIMLQPGAGLLVGGDDYLTQDGSSLMTIDDIMRREKEGSFAGSFINAGNNEKLLLQDHTDKNMETSEHDIFNKTMHDDGFGAGIGDGGLLSEGFIGESGLFDEPPMSVATLGDDNIGGLDDDLDDDPIGGILSHPPQTPASVEGPHSAGAPSSNSILPGSPSSTSHHHLFRSVVTSPKSAGSLLIGSDLSGAHNLNATTSSSRTHQLTLGQHTFDEREVFTLEPLDATAYIGSGEKQVRSKRRRKLVVDQSKGIDGDEMRAQLADSSDLVTDLDLAPPSKKLMQWKETGGVGKLLHLPGYPQKCKTILKLITQQINVSSKYTQDSLAGDGPCAVGPSDDDVDLGATALSNGKRGNSTGHRNHEESGNQAKRSRTDDTSPEKRLDASHRSADYDYDEESHASPGGYVDEDDDYFNRDTPSAPTTLPPHATRTGHSHTLTPEAMPHPMDDFQLEPLQLEPPMVEQEPLADVSTAAIEPEELQEEGESFETFQERVWGKRAMAFFTNIKRTFETSMPGEDSSKVLTFSTFTHHHPSGRRMDRKTVAAKFYSLLVLKKDQVIDIAQDEAYGPIYISRGAKYVA